MTICDDVILVVIGCVISGIFTLFIVQSNRRKIERNNRIDMKNELLRNFEVRALYIWSGNKSKEFNIGLEHIHLMSDIKRIKGIYKELGGGNVNNIPSELIELRLVATKDIEVVVDSPETLTSEKSDAIKSRIEYLTEVLESIPPKK